MNEHPLKKTLRHIAEEEFPPGTDLWPEIQQAMERANPKRNEMAIRFSNFTRAVAFGAMLVLLTLGLAWVLSSAGPQPVASPTATPAITQTISSEELITEVPIPSSQYLFDDPLKSFISHQESSLLFGPGWLHLKTQIHDPRAQLPNGVLIAEEFIQENWYLLNEQSQVIQSISIMTTLDGEIIQVVVITNGLTHNLTFGTSGVSDPFTPDLFYGFVNLINDLMVSPVEPNPANKFIFTELYNENKTVGYKFVLHTEEVEWQAILDSDTGKLTSLNEYHFSGDPLRKDLFSSYTPEIQERVDQPPADILAYLDMESVPYTDGTPSLPAPVTYIVQEGDTCLQIATIYNVSVQSIITLNKLSSSCTLVVGQELQIPTPTPSANYQIYRNSGIEKILAGDLEGGLLDLDKAEKIQGLDGDAAYYADLASQYLLGVSFWEVDWEQAVYYFGQVAHWEPGLHDGTGFTAGDRYVTVLETYISQLINEQNWCEALRYHKKLEVFDPAKATESVFQTTRTELTDQCLIQKPPLISMDSTSETIRQALIDNKANWRTIFVEVMITHTDGNATTLTYGRVWFVTPDKGRGMYDIHNDNLVDRFVFTNNTIQTTFDFNPDAEPRWIETTQILDTLPSPLLSILDPGPAFAMNGTQSSGGNFNPTGTETIAGRETLIVEWSDDTGVLKDRLWIDIFTGVVLKWENLREGYLDTLDGEQYLMDAKVEVLDVLYDEKYWDEMLFNPMLPDEPIYMKYP
ncbi:MAG: LysM peptidoglycan-binding domain-containing protein [Anaerolineales bacterium]|nr:LysM peptidoglycan-binding domain-containing protein [Anaerolineales bacterium]